MTRRLRVTSGAVEGQTFRSPSSAAAAAVTVLNPDRKSPQTNGWNFWRLVSNGARLAVLR